MGRRGRINTIGGGKRDGKKESERNESQPPTKHLARIFVFLSGFCLLLDVCDLLLPFLGFLL